MSNSIRRQLCVNGEEAGGAGDGAAGGRTVTGHPKLTGITSAAQQDNHELLEKILSKKKNQSNKMIRCVEIHAYKN